MHGRALLVGFEVALSTMLLIAAGLLMNSFTRLIHVNTGFRAEHGISARLDLPGAAYRDDKAAAAFYDKLLTSLQSQPGITAAGIISQLPLDGESWEDDISRPGDTRPTSSRPWTNVRFVSGSYFAAIGIPILEGRAFANRTGEKKDVVVVSAAVAHEFWPKENALGQTLLLQSRPMQVIGVVRDTRADIDKAPPLMVYVPYWASNIGSVSSFTVVLRSSLNSQDAVELLRHSVSSLDRGVPVSRVRTFDQILSDSVAPRRFQTMLAGIFGIAALSVAVLGIFGIIAGLVAARRSEIGIRMALGATSANVLRMVLRQGLAPVIVGLIGGIGMSIVFGSVLRTLLYQVSPTDPMTLCGVAMLILIAATLACWIPARRAARIDPTEALRYE